MKQHSKINIDTVKFRLSGMEFDLSKASDGYIVQSINKETGHLRFQGNNRIALNGDLGEPLSLRTTDFHQTLQVEGSLGKFLFGQNLFTSDDLPGLCATSLKKIFIALGMRRTPEVAARIWKGVIELQRVDLACNFALDSEAHVTEIIGQLKRRFIAGNCVVHSSPTWVSLCPDKGSQYSITFYAKGAELRSSAFLRGENYRSEMLENSTSTLRVEVRLQGDLKALGLNQASAWSKGTAEKVFWDYVKSLNLEEVSTGPLHSEELMGLPQKLRAAYALYKLGCHKEQFKLMFSKATLQRYRTDFRKHGVEIAYPNISSTPSATVRDAICVERVICDLPRWVKKAGLAPGELIQPPKTPDRD